MRAGDSLRTFTLLVVIIFLGFLRADEVEGGETESPAPAVETENGKSEPIWTDQPQEWINEALYRRVLWLDSMFYDNDMAPRKDPRSRFRLKIFTVLDPENLEKPSLDGKASASVRLPGLQDRFRLILDSDDLDTFPGSSPDEVRSSNRLALRRIGSWLDADVGAKVGTSPVAFARLTARHHWATGPVQWHANQRFYFETGEGFGTLSSLAQHHWIHRKWMLGHVSAARWSEATTGVEWQDRLSLLRVLRVIEDEKHGQFIGDGDISHGAGIRLGANGREDGSHEMSRYQLALVYRRPLFRRDYLYLEINPEVQWKRENDWNPDYTLRVGLDILFWRDR